MIKKRACPHCRTGDVEFSEDSYNIIANCIQCGWYKERPKARDTSIPPNLYSARYDTIAHLYTKGWRADSIAAELECARGTVFRGVEARGVNRRVKRSTSE
ncbi:MAG: hypothetical protein JW384_02798 [Nitrosomonadaceae bacterium]|nr:hypothetical protein [Nitrosomonadaceae bacterium]